MISRGRASRHPEDPRKSAGSGPHPHRRPTALRLLAVLVLCTACEPAAEDGAVGPALEPLTGAISPLPPGAPIGDRCRYDVECDSGCCAAERRDARGTTWLGGACTASCSVTEPCPVGATCVPFAGGDGLCAAPCADGRDCRAGYVCSRAVAACLPDCRLGWDCGARLDCDRATGACRTPRRGVGAPCEFDRDCTSGLCSPLQRTPGGEAWTGGYCTARCKRSQSCPEGARCVPLADGRGLCAAACARAADCRTGYVCAPAVRACLPDCRRGWSCGPWLRCDGATGLCRGPVR
ncbi:MAG: hypothetical protein JW751_08850 [Polyangiaceae bacterium]|nr:hypothetical protein [Polyangiaceae bacterium]